jgi:hypothetical protein
MLPSVVLVFHIVGVRLSPLPIDRTVARAAMHGVNKHLFHSTIRIRYLYDSSYE